MRRSTRRVLELLLPVCVGAAGCGGDHAGTDAAGSGAELEGSGSDRSGSAAAHGRCDGTPGAAGLGDPYFPGSGNGGYDVDRYHLQVKYDPATDELEGVATFVATATQDLSRFNMDLDGLTVDAIDVDRAAATWTRDGGELMIAPARCIREHTQFRGVIRYHGIPEPVTTGPLAQGGFVPMEDGALVAGEPQVAAKWFPVNDHPRDAARYTLDITAPAELKVIANGELVDQHTHDGWTTWRWQAREPMAPYLLGWTMGHYEVNAYHDRGLSFVDAIDADLFVPPIVPVSGDHVALSGQADLSYKRLTRTIAVPASGGELSFHVQRDTESSFDYFFVEAHVVGSDAWTTLPDVDGFAQQSAGFCSLLFVHPFVMNYLTPDPDGDPEPCLPSGLTGEWWAATGASDGWEQWRIDLSRYAGQEVEISLTYASDDSVQELGVVIDDIACVAGEGATSFEDGDTGGWQVPGAPPPPTVNENDWVVAGLDDLPRPPAEAIQATLARQGEILEFEGSLFGAYPFRDAGAIVHDSPDVGFALENQTRPTYRGSFFGGSDGGLSTVVHELAHQWFGDLVRLDTWQHTWLNEGFASYAEWLWAEAKEDTPTDVTFDNFYAIPAESPFWQLVIGDPGGDAAFDFPIYGRGAMTLHRLRRTVGDEAFFQILRSWASSAHTATTADFIALAEEVSGQELDELFDAWLYTAGRPDLPSPLASPSATPADEAAQARAAELVRSIASEARGHR
jgi:hypothetical protein